MCGSQEQLQRKRVKALLATLEAENPNVRRNLLAALGNVRPTHLLDHELRAKLGLVEANESDDARVPLLTLGRALGVPVGDAE